jgi:hypothetical protein
MGSIDQNLRSCAGVEKERRCGIPLTASERLEQRPTLVDRWIAERAAQRCRNPALIGRAIVYGKGVGTAGSGDELTSSQGEPV